MNFCSKVAQGKRQPLVGRVSNARSVFVQAS